MYVDAGCWIGRCVRSLTVVVSAGNTNVSRLEKLCAECPGSFIKAGMVSHGFGVNGEADNYEGKGKICHTEGYHCRGESWPFCQHGYYTEVTGVFFPVMDFSADVLTETISMWRVVLSRK